MDHRKLIILLVSAGALFGIGYYSGLKRHGSSASKMEQLANDKERDAREAVKRAELAEIEEGKAKVIADEAGRKTDALEAERKRLRSLLQRAENANGHDGILPDIPVATASCGSAGLGLDGNIDQLKKCYKLQRELIDVQDKELSTCREQIKGLNEALNQSDKAKAFYKKAYEDENIRANLLKAALEAQKAANKAEYWKGFMHGSMIGGCAGGGYAYSRMK